MIRAIALSLLALFVGAFDLFADTGEVSFTPTGVKIPIMKISIAREDGTGEQILYQCASSTEADCLVDLTDQAALDTLAAAANAAEIEPGSYRTIALSTCSFGDEKTDVYLKGSFTASSVTYLTDSDEGSDDGIKQSGSVEFTKITNWGCAGKTINLPKALVVAAGETVDLTVVVDNTFAAFSTPGTSPGMGGCKAPAGGLSRGVCLTYPALLPYVGVGTPTMERYKVAHHASNVGSIVDNKANAIVIVAADEAGTPLMAYGRPFYSETSAGWSSNTSAPSDAVFGGPNYGNETDVASFTVNSDGTIKFFQGDAENDTHSAVFSAFQRADHTGTVSTHGGTNWKYHAIPFTP